MEITDWLMLVAVIVALGLGVSSLIQTQRLQKRERKERLLNEIIDWATEVAKSAVSRQKKDKTQLWKTKLEYGVWKAKSTYITGVANSSFGGLVPFIEKINCRLDKAIKATEKELDKKTVKEISTECIKKSEGELTEAVKELFKEAAKIKTRDIN